MVIVHSFPWKSSPHPVILEDCLVGNWLRGVCSASCSHTSVYFSSSLILWIPPFLQDSEWALFSLRPAFSAPATHHPSQKIGTPKLQGLREAEWPKVMGNSFQIHLSKFLLLGDVRIAWEFPEKAACVRVSTHHPRNRIRSSAQEVS